MKREGLENLQNHKNEGSVLFKAPTDTDEVNTQPAKIAIRAKRREVKLRLDDHCKHFPDWTQS